jgi:hypothetical protein
MKHPTRIGAIVSETPALNQLIQRARELQEIDRTVGAWLPELLRDRVKVAVTRGDTLVLIAESAVWATRLRYEIPELLEQARATPALAHIDRIQVRVDTSA